MHKKLWQNNELVYWPDGWRHRKMALEAEAIYLAQIVTSLSFQLKRWWKKSWIDCDGEKPISFPSAPAWHVSYKKAVVSLNNNLQETEEVLYDNMVTNFDEWWLRTPTQMDFSEWPLSKQLEPNDEELFCTSSKISGTDLSPFLRWNSARMQSVRYLLTVCNLEFFYLLDLILNVTILFDFHFCSYRSDQQVEDNYEDPTSPFLGVEMEANSRHQEDESKSTNEPCLVSSRQSPLDLLCQNFAEWRLCPSLTAARLFLGRQTRGRFGEGKSSISNHFPSSSFIENLKK